jgi:4-hydroxybenzoate polyprenyltransferase
MVTSYKTSVSIFEIVTTQVLHRAYILWLFTESDLFTFVVPNTIFGISGTRSGFFTSSAIPLGLYLTVSSIFKVFIFNWLNLLIFDLANQSMPSAESEDAINKPWRPVPSGRISIEDSRKLLLTCIPIVWVINYLFSVHFEASVLMILTWMYNDLGGGDLNCYIRNAIICAAFGFYNLGSLKVASGSSPKSGEIHVNLTGYIWIAVISLIIFTTMHIQDLKDQAGDLQRGRKTAPIAFGDSIARWTIAVPLTLWGIFIPIFWGTGPYILVCCAGLAVYIAVRVVCLTNPEQDSMSWKFWTMWTAMVYNIPLISNLK